MSSISSGSFKKEMDSILKGVKTNADEALKTAVTEGTRRGARNWRKNARQQFPTGKTYKKGGKTYTTGAYAKSVRSRVLKGERPSGVIHSTMPGLPHLLEFGHVKVGGGLVPGREHVAPAAEDAFDHTMKVLKEELEHE